MGSSNGDVSKLIFYFYHLLWAYNQLILVSLIVNTCIGLVVNLTCLINNVWLHMFEFVD